MKDIKSTGVAEANINCVELSIKGRCEEEVLNDLRNKRIIKEWSRIDWLGNYKISFK